MASGTAPDIVALIPARSGSKRIADKNVRLLGGHPLIAYAVAAAQRSEIFSSVIVSTDSERYAQIAKHYGAEVPWLRPAEIAGERSPDVEWVEFTLRRLADEGRSPACFSILRPTSPFRQPETIRRAWAQFLSDPAADSLRAVERCRQHPGKMWTVRGNRMTPLVPQPERGVPAHSQQYQALPEVFAQNASLEIAWSRVVLSGQGIAGRDVMPFLTQGHEGLDVNEPRDWWYAEELLRRGEARLPHVAQEPMRVTEEA